MMKIISIDFNFAFTNESAEVETFTVGDKGCVEIEEHSAKGEGDKWYYDCHFEGGKMIRIFNPNRVDYDTK
jgi:hypothetical protein